MSLTQNFSITVEDVNEAPVDIRLSSNDIIENFIGAIGKFLAKSRSRAAVKFQGDSELT